MIGTCEVVQYLLYDLDGRNRFSLVFKEPSTIYVAFKSPASLKVPFFDMISPMIISRTLLNTLGKVHGLYGTSHLLHSLYPSFTLPIERNENIDLIR